MAHNNEIYTLNDLRVTTGTSNIGGRNLIELWKASYTESSPDSHWLRRYHDINTGHVSWNSFTSGAEQNYQDLLEPKPPIPDESGQSKNKAGFGWPPPELSR